MPRINENGNLPSVEDVFLALNTRLNNINDGILDFKEFYSGYEQYYSSVETLNDIKNHIHGIPLAKGIGAISYSLNLIQRIHELKKNLDENISRETKESWINNNERFEDIDLELSQYTYHLERIQKELLVRIDEEAFLNPNGEKIKMNITTEQLAALLYFINKDKFFKANKRQLCRAFMTVFCQEDGDEITFEYLYNKITDFKNSESTIQFWKARFDDYTNQLEDI